MRLDGSLRGQCGESREEVEEELEIEICTGEKGNCTGEVKKRAQAGWSGWRRVAGVICDRRVSARIKGKFYKTAVMPAMYYGTETAPMTQRQEAERDEEYVNRRRLEMDPPGRRKRRRPKRRFMEALKEDLREKSVKDEDTEERLGTNIITLRILHICDIDEAVAF
ncbi:uncharacterized protein [Penaeus vannamei]|uniref:uncharacterized protein n=1 Tax=Penaeus vannamei TaxID=6689 RepID=UPI00387F5FC2